MLILSRKHGESVVIDGRIKLTVCAIKGNVAQLGIEAPKEIPIRRSEIRQKIREAPPVFPSTTIGSEFPESHNDFANY